MKEEFIEWASANLLFQAECGGLDHRQIGQQFTWFQFQCGNLDIGSQLARDIIEAGLRDLGAKPQEIEAGSHKYSFWNVIPRNWIAGRRDVPREFIEVLDDSCFFITDEAEPHKSFGLASSKLMWVFREVSIAGLPFQDAGKSYSQFMGQFAGGYPVTGDSWMWKPHTATQPMGEGLLRLGKYDLKPEWLHSGAKLPSKV